MCTEGSAHLFIRSPKTNFTLNVTAEFDDKKKGDPIMSKKLLVAVDDSIHAKNAIKYACNISASVKEMNFTLFHVQPMISQYLLDEAKKDLAADAELKKIINKNTEAGKSLLQKYKE
jgi:hypothetical protein